MTRPALQTQPKGGHRMLKLEDIKRTAIIERLAVYNWNRTATAKSLGLSLRGLRIVLKRYKAQGAVFPEGRAASRRPKQGGAQWGPWGDI